jgi:hypothetical protein
MEDLPLFSFWRGRSYGSKIVIRAILTAFSTPEHLALPPTVGWQGAPFCVESAYLSCRLPSSVGSRLRSHKTETCPEIVGPKIRSPQCPDCGQWNQTWRASIRRHRRAQGGSQTLRSIQPKHATLNTTPSRSGSELTRRRGRGDSGASWRPADQRQLGFLSNSATPSRLMPSSRRAS